MIPGGDGHPIQPLGGGVISMGLFLSIQALHEEGLANKVIARRLDVDVRTVRKHIRRIAAGARETWLLVTSSPQSSRVTSATFRVETPWTYISATASLRARSLRTPARGPGGRSPGGSVREAGEPGGSAGRARPDGCAGAWA